MPTGDVSDEVTGRRLGPVCADARQVVRDADRECLFTICVYESAATPKLVTKN